MPITGPRKRNPNKKVEVECPVCFATFSIYKSVLKTRKIPPVCSRSCGNTRRSKKMTVVSRDPQWIDKISRRTKEALRTPAIRRRHLKGLRNRV